MDGSQGFPNDVAVVKLTSAADLNDPFVGAVAMAEGAEDFADASCYITGWGVTTGQSTLMLALYLPDVNGAL